MGLSKNYALEQIRHTLGRETSRRVDVLDVLNQAGHHFYGVRDWLHARRPAALLDFQAGEKLVELPIDFGSYSALTAREGLVRGFQLVTPGELDLYRAGTLGQNWVYWGAFVNQAAEDGSIEERLEVYPTPEADQAEALILRYRAGWVHVHDDTENLAVPEFCRGLYLAYARAFARGIEFEDVAPLSARLREIDQGTLLRRAARQDSAQQREVGRLTNGAVNPSRAYNIPYPPVGDPSGP